MKRYPEEEEEEKYLGNKVKNNNKEHPLLNMETLDLTLKGSEKISICRKKKILKNIYAYRKSVQSDRLFRQNRLA